MDFRGRIKEILKRSDVDAVLVSQRPNLIYFSGFDTGYLISDGENHLLLVPRLELSRAMETTEVEISAFSEYETEISEFESDKVHFKKPEDLIYQELDGMRLDTVGVDSKIEEDLQEKIKSAGIEIKNISKEVQDMRSIKDKDEINRIEKAIEITGKAIESIEDKLREGVKELEILGEIEREMRYQGAQGFAFDGIVAFGSNTKYPHAKPGEKRLRKGEPVLIDVGAKFKEYCADVTRTIFPWSPSDREREVFNSVLESQEMAIEKSVINVKISEIDKEVRNCLREKGLLKFFNHSTGHGIGLEVHEAPRVYPKEEKRAKENQVFTIEPGVYMEFGVRIEDDVLITKNGPKILSKNIPGREPI